MIRREEHWFEVIERFQQAALDEGRWTHALAGLSAACRSLSSRLVGLFDDAEPVNWADNLDPGLLARFVEAGGLDPQRNPRVRAAMSAALLQVLNDDDILRPGERARTPFLADFCERTGLLHVCQTTLVREQGRLIGLALIRDRRQGPIDSDSQDVFARLAPHVRAAVRTQIALEGRSTQLLAGALESAQLAAFVCGEHGHVRAMTPEAEQLLATAGGLSLKDGFLQAVHAENQEQLERMIHGAAQERAASPEPMMQSLLLRRGTEAPTQVLDIVRLPRRDYGFGFLPRVLVLARGARRPRGSVMLLLRSAFGLSDSEADIALALADGDSVDRIAARRKVAIGTVRGQIKHVYAKLGVSRQAELVAQVHRMQ